MLNGRAVEDGDAMERLRTIPSENIERIEIIPIPPSRYSAEGDIGLVNVVLKKDPTHGVSGDMRLWGQQNHHSQTSFTGNLNYRSKKWEIKVGASPYVGQYMNASTQEYTYKDGKSFQYQEYHPAYRGFYTNEIVKFKPNNNMELGAILSHTTQDNNTGYDGTIDLLGAEPNSSIATWSHVKLHTLNTNLSAYADVNLDSLGKKLSFTYNLTRKKNATHSDMSSTQSGKIDATQSDFDNHYLVHSGLIDVELPFRTFKMETGVSGLFINNDSYNNLFNINNGIATPNADQTNNFKYKEQTFGVYVSASAQLGKHWSAKAGLRYEHTHTEGFSPTMNSLVKKNYGDLFPTAYLSWNPNNKNTFSLSYARRINRPYFTALNPFRMYITANAYSSGSPDLKPVISNTVELTYNYAGRLNFTIWHGQIKNVITDVKKMTEDGMTVSTIQNTFDSSEFGLGINYMRSLFTWCSLNLGTNLHYQHQTVSDPSLNIKNTEGFGGRMFAMADFTLNKSKTLFSGISFFQFLPTVDGLAYTRGSANVNVYITYNIIKDKLKMNLSASDIFKQSFTTRKYYYTEYKLRDKFFYDARCVELSFTYFFGKKKVNSVYKQTKDVLNGRAY